MTLSINNVLIIFGLFSLVVFIKSLYETSKKNNSFGETPYLCWMGIFVWGDAIIFGIFWIVAALVSLIFNDFILFLLIVSVFWTVRSFGEMVYWFNQQFSTLVRNPPEKMRGFKLIRSNSIWFVYQIIWQCVLVISIITSIYFTFLWINNFE